MEFISPSFIIPPPIATMTTTTRQSSSINTTNERMLLSYKSWKNPMLLSELIDENFDEQAYIAQRIQLQRTNSQGSNNSTTINAPTTNRSPHLSPVLSATTIGSTLHAVSIASEDTAVTLQELQSLCTELQSELNLQVSTRYSSLLSSASQLASLQRELKQTSSRLHSLQSHMLRVGQLLDQPYEKLKNSTQSLANIQIVGELARYCARFTLMNERLHQQLTNAQLIDAIYKYMETGQLQLKNSTTTVGGASYIRELSKASSCISEMRSILSEADLSGIECIDNEKPFLEASDHVIRSYLSNVLHS